MLKKEILSSKANGNLIYRNFDPPGIPRDEEEVLSPKKKIVRTYMANGKIGSEIGIERDPYDQYHERENGINRTWYENGNLKKETHVKDSAMDGETILYYSNGKKCASDFFVNGQSQGKARCWDEKGNQVRCPNGNIFEWRRGY